MKNDHINNKAENIVDETDAKYIEFERCNEDNDIEGVVKSWSRRSMRSDMLQH